VNLRIVWMATVVVLAGLAVPTVYGQGSVKGQVIWSDKVIPKAPELNVNTDKMHCLSKGKLLDDSLLIDPKTKGIKNVVFWLVDAKEPLKVLPTPKELLDKKVSIDQPCCMFIERITVVLDGQELIVKNSSPVSHNVNINGGAAGPTQNTTIPAGREISLGKIKARAFPTIPYSCTIHAWMKGFVVVPNSPYYALTDAEGKFEIKNVPAGNYRLVGWHERIGWIFPGAKMEARNIPVTVTDKQVTELKPLLRKLEDDDE